MGRETGGSLGREGTWVYLRLILVDVCRKQENPVKQLSFQLKKIFKDKRKKIWSFLAKRKI